MDRALKQRLVGASVLIALAVIVLPMLLGGRPEGSSDSSKIEIPPKPPELDFESRRFPVGESARNDGSPPETQSDVLRRLPQPPPEPSPERTRERLPDPGSDPAADDASVVDITPLGERDGDGVQPAETDSANELDAEIIAARDPLDEEVDRIMNEGAGNEGAGDTSPTVDEPGQGRYLVQVASFGSAENANRLAATLREAGYDVLLDSVTSDVGVLNRVRIGPYASESDATDAAARVGAMVKGSSPRVLDLEPEAAAAVTRPADPLVRWVVQVGSFSNADNATNLVSRLRQREHPAYSETLTRSGSAIHRVRIGPYVDREAALAASRAVADEFGLEGVVMSAD